MVVVVVVALILARDLDLPLSFSSHHIQVPLFDSLFASLACLILIKANEEFNWISTGALVSCMKCIYAWVLFFLVYSFFLYTVTSPVLYIYHIHIHTYIFRYTLCSVHRHSN